MHLFIPRQLKLPAVVITAVALSVALTACDPTLLSGGSGYMHGVGKPTHRPADNGPHHSRSAIPDDVSFWDGDGVGGSATIRINRKQQKAFFYKGSTLVGVSRISSGSGDNATPPGRYRISQKSKDHKSSLYGAFKDKETGITTNKDVDTRVDKPAPNEEFHGAPMPNFMRFNHGIGMHTGYLPGYADSHGCIRMPHHMSEKFFENAVVGTPVIVE